MYVKSVLSILLFPIEKVSTTLDVTIVAKQSFEKIFAMYNATVKKYHADN